MLSRRMSVRAAGAVLGLALMTGLTLPAAAQISLTTIGSAYTQDFNTLATSGTANTALPTGWALAESGSSTRNNSAYAASTGSDNAGDVYSFGATSNAERAFGTLRSGTLVPIIGASFTNNTGSTIAALTISYTGEEWRLGTLGRADRIDFQLSTNATSLTTGTFTDYNSLDFSSPTTTGATGALNGNLAANRTAISATISGFSIPNGATFWIRWTDFDASGADDGLGVDDFSLTPIDAPSGVGLATPPSGQPGDSTLLTVTVTPATNPASTGITVVGDLTPIGGSATQTFFDDGTNGDVTGSDGIFSYQATVVVGTTPGAKSLGFAVSDAQARSSTGGISYTVDPPFLAIHTIQGTGSTSPYAGQLVKTSGIVTGLKTTGFPPAVSGFFVQTPDADADSDPNTSEGIFVFTGSVPAVSVGDEVTVTGKIQEFVPSADPFSPPITEFSGGPTIQVVSSGNALPFPITLTAADTDPNGGIEQLEKYEFMRVHVDSLTATSPTDGFVDEANATSDPDGSFYGVITGIARPYREPGIEIPEPDPAGSPCCVPSFDGNPERLRVDTDAQPGGVDLNVATGAVVTDLTGPLDYQFRTYTILADPGTPPSAVGGMVVVPAPDPAADEFTVGSANLERFFDTVDDAGTSDAVLTPAAFANRLAKVSLMIRNVLKSPDILGVEEVEHQSTLDAIAAKVNADTVAAGGTDPGYVAYLEEGNDIGGIDSGFLVKSTRVAVDSVTQVGLAATYINPNTGSPELLNDRPPLVLRSVVYNDAGTASFPVTVIVNHLRSLGSINSTDPNGSGTEGARVRAKRAAQAEYLADLIESIQDTENVISVGDYNAFQFSDGYVDGIGTIKGTPTPMNEVVVSSTDLVDPDLTNLVDLQAPADRYSYVFGGNAQEIDHILVDAEALSIYSHMGHPRVNADFPESLRGDATRPERISDHDPVAAYFVFPAGSVSVTPNPQQYTDKVTFTAQVTPAVSGGQPTATSVDFYVGTQFMGTATSPVTIAGALVFTLADVPLLEPVPFGTLPTGQMAPGVHTVTAVFGGSPSGVTIPDATTPLTITQENASAAYSGALFVSTACATCSNATVTLAATVTDDTDPDTGEIRNATVTFVNLDTMTDISPALTPGLVSAGDTTVGVVTYNWNIDIGSTSSQDFTIGVRVDNYYTRAAAADAIVTVSKPLASFFITGGGYLTLTSSAGIEAGDVDSKNNFGFNVQYNKKGTNLQGRINTLVRRTESDATVHTYQIKGTVLTSLSVKTSDGTATFTGKASIRDVTDPMNPMSVDGNATLLVTMDDNGEPGSSDKIGITIFNKQGGLWFSSNWSGTKTTDQTLSAGNLIVH